LNTSSTEESTSITGEVIELGETLPAGGEGEIVSMDDFPELFQKSAPYLLLKVQTPSFSLGEKRQEVSYFREGSSNPFPCIPPELQGRGNNLPDVRSKPRKHGMPFFLSVIDARNNGIQAEDCRDTGFRQGLKSMDTVLWGRGTGLKKPGFLAVQSRDGDAYCGLHCPQKISVPYHQGRFGQNQYGHAFPPAKLENRPCEFPFRFHWGIGVRGVGKGEVEGFFTFSQVFFQKVEEGRFLSNLKGPGDKGGDVTVEAPVGTSGVRVQSILWRAGTELSLPGIKEAEYSHSASQWG